MDLADVFHYIMTVVVALLSGVTVAVINNRVRGRADKASRLRDQLQNLYGPLLFYVTQSQQCFNQSDQVRQAGGEEYGQRRIGGDESAEIGHVMDVANDYVSIARKNNARILSILRSNYYLIDPDDMECFNEFTLHYMREMTEYEAGDLPYAVVHRLPNISFLPKEFAERVRDKFLLKKEQLAKLEGWRSKKGSESKKTADNGVA